MSALRPLLPLALIAWSLGGMGCDLLAPNSPLAFEDGADEAVSGAPEGNRGFDATPGCPTALVSGGDVPCATCDFAVEPICGVAEVARCESRQNADGQPCELCVTDDGVVLYDDCFLGGAVSAATCESAPGATPDEACSVCFDTLGAVVSTLCAPAADGCEAVVGADGQACSRCGGVDLCERVDLDPATCRRYGNDVGQCIDCLDDDGAILSHACTPVGGARVCEERVQPEGLVCTICFDAAGLAVEQGCREAVPQLERCEQLVFAEQVCTVCVDGQDRPTFVDCQSTACEAPTDAIAACRSDADCAATEACFNGVCEPRRGEAPAPPPSAEADGGCSAPVCEMTRGDDGALCRTCPVSSGGVETRCLSAAPLSCEILPESELPEASRDVVGEDFTGDAGAEAPPESQGRLCVLCRDREAGVEVYRDCDGNGAVPPPSCTEVLDESGATCAACFDAVTNDPVFTTCGDARCYDRGDQPLLAISGAPLTVDGADAVATCERCSVDGADTATCRLPARCGDALFADVATCGGTAVLTLSPRRCENPWEAWRAGVERDDDLAGLLAFSLERHQLTLQAATSAPTTTTACSDGCACPRGDLVEIVVDEADVDLARRAFADLLVP